MKRSRLAWVLHGLLILPTLGCGSIQNLVEEPAVYGGVRFDLRGMDHDPESMVFCLVDLPFSACLDTGLLPLTGLFELYRWLFGWPPPPGY